MWLVILFMRTFHIFNVNDDISNLLKNDTYPLYRSFLKIKNLKEEDLSIGINIYEQIALPIEKEKINKRLYIHYKESCFYTKYLSRHSYINKYRDEESILNVSSSHIKLKTNMVYPEFFKYLKKDSHLFVCDFDNSDFFWLKDI